MEEITFFILCFHNHVWQAFKMYTIPDSDRDTPADKHAACNLAYPCARDTRTIQLCGAERLSSTCPTFSSACSSVFRCANGKHAGTPRMRELLYIF